MGGILLNAKWILKPIANLMACRQNTQRMECRDIIGKVRMLESDDIVTFLEDYFITTRINSESVTVKGSTEPRPDLKSSNFEMSHLRFVNSGSIELSIL